MARAAHLGVYRKFYQSFVIRQRWDVHGEPELTPHFNYASPSSGEAYRDRQLTTNFEFWVEIFCVPTCFHMRIPKPCLSVRLSVCPSVRTPRKEITMTKLRQYQSYNSNWCINGKVFTSRYYSMETLKLDFFFKKVRNSNFDLWRWAEITQTSSISVLQ